jgi:hypothetical protein
MAIKKALLDTLVTGNTRHYQYIQSVGYPLVIANWREEPK